MLFGSVSKKHVLHRGISGSDLEKRILNEGLGFYHSIPLLLCSNQPQPLFSPVLAKKILISGIYISLLKFVQKIEFLHYLTILIHVRIPHRRSAVCLAIFSQVLVWYVKF